MAKFIDRTGESKINSQGLLMTIIKYNNSADITIKFEDGTILEHRTYSDFKNGSINNPNYDMYSNRIGEFIINKQGLKMTIIEYINATDITVQFEDGTMVEHKTYNNFKKGSINNPNYRIGETNTNNQRLKMTIIKYINYNDITVQFEDGTIIKHRRYGEFKNGTIRNPNYDYNNRINNRIGETNTNNQGLKMTIIKYNGSLDITVQFEDGTIIEHRSYDEFKKGKIKNPNYKYTLIIDRTGETNTNNQGLLMTIIKYINAMDITVQFEDGTIIEHKAYSAFKIGEIKNPNYDYNRTGETNTNKQGLLMTIIKYINAMDITVQFEDGTIIEHRSYNNFKNGSIKNPNYRIGKSVINKQGLKMTIIEYNSYNDITVQFEDGTIVEHRQYGEFKNGSINNPNYDIYSNRIGETNINNQGLKMTIIKYPNSKDISVQFEDGTIIEHRAYDKFKLGTIRNPNFSFPYQLPNTDIILEKVAYIYKDQANYLYKCNKCGIKEIDTLENIIKHSKHKDLKLNKIKSILPYQIPHSDIILQKIVYIRENDVNYLYKCDKCKLEDIDILENINNHKCAV